MCICICEVSLCKY